MLSLASQMTYDGKKDIETISSHRGRNLKLIVNDGDEQVQHEEIPKVHHQIEVAGCPAVDCVMGNLHQLCPTLQLDDVQHDQHRTADVLEADQPETRPLRPRHGVVHVPEVCRADLVARTLLGPRPMRQTNSNPGPKSNRTNN